MFLLLLFSVLFVGKEIRLVKDNSLEFVIPHFVPEHHFTMHVLSVFDSFKYEIGSVLWMHYIGWNV